jgi:hypothetical protein
MGELESTRLKGYDYAEEGRYFVTIRTRNRPSRREITMKTSLMVPEAIEKKYLPASQNSMRQSGDKQFAVIFRAIRELMTPPKPPTKRPIGFGVEEPEARYRVARKPAWTNTGEENRDCFVPTEESGLAMTCGPMTWHILSLRGTVSSDEAISLL